MPAKKSRKCKDGSLDMRYKSNKTAVQTGLWLNKSTPSPYIGSSSFHLTKNGTLDMRYKENKELVESNEIPRKKQTTNNFGIITPNNINSSSYPVGQYTNGEYSEINYEEINEEGNNHDDLFNDDDEYDFNNYEEENDSDNQMMDQEPHIFKEEKQEIIHQPNNANPPGIMPQQNLNQNANQHENSFSDLSKSQMEVYPLIKDSDNNGFSFKNILEICMNPNLEVDYIPELNAFSSRFAMFAVYSRKGFVVIYDIKTAAKSKTPYDQIEIPNVCSIYFVDQFETPILIIGTINSINIYDYRTKNFNNIIVGTPVTKIINLINNPEQIYFQMGDKLLAIEDIHDDERINIKEVMLNVKAISVFDEKQIIIISNSIVSLYNIENEKMNEFGKINYFTHVYGSYRRYIIITMYGIIGSPYVNLTLIDTKCPNSQRIFGRIEIFEGNGEKKLYCSTSMYHPFFLLGSNQNIDTYLFAIEDNPFSLKKIETYDVGITVTRSNRGKHEKVQLYGLNWIDSIVPNITNQASIFVYYGGEDFIIYNFEYPKYVKEYQNIHFDFPVSISIYGDDENIEEEEDEEEEESEEEEEEDIGDLDYIEEDYINHEPKVKLQTSETKIVTTDKQPSKPQINDAKHMVRSQTMHQLNYDSDLILPLPQKECWLDYDKEISEIPSEFVDNSISIESNIYQSHDIPEKSNAIISDCTCLPESTLFASYSDEDQSLYMHQMPSSEEKVNSKIAWNFETIWKTSIKDVKVITFFVQGEDIDLCVGHSAGLKVFNALTGKEVSTMITENPVTAFVTIPTINKQLFGLSGNMLFSYDYNNQRSNVISEDIDFISYYKENIILFIRKGLLYTYDVVSTDYDDICPVYKNTVFLNTIYSRTPVIVSINEDVEDAEIVFTIVDVRLSQSKSYKKSGLFYLEEDDKKVSICAEKALPILFFSNFSNDLLSFFWIYDINHVKEITINEGNNLCKKYDENFDVIPYSRIQLFDNKCEFMESPYGLMTISNDGTVSLCDISIQEHFLSIPEEEKSQENEKSQEEGKVITTFEQDYVYVPKSLFNSFSNPIQNIKGHNRRRKFDLLQVPIIHKEEPITINLKSIQHLKNDGKTERPKSQENIDKPRLAAKISCPKGETPARYQTQKQTSSTTTRRTNRSKYGK